MGTIWRDQIPALAEQMMQDQTSAIASDIEKARKRSSQGLDAADQYIMQAVNELDDEGFQEVWSFLHKPPVLDIYCTYVLHKYYYCS